MQATKAQATAILEQIQSGRDNPEIASYDFAAFGYDLYPSDAEGLAVQFHYKRHDDDAEQIPGLEVTVFAVDGSVIESQDFG